MSSRFSSLNSPFVVCFSESRFLEYNIFGKLSAVQTIIFELVRASKSESAVSLPVIACGDSWQRAGAKETFFPNPSAQKEKGVVCA